MALPARVPGGTERVVLDAVRELVGELRSHNPPPVQLDSDLEHDLGLDSLALAELLVRLEELSGSALPATLLQAAVTPRDLAAAIVPAPSRGTPASAATPLPGGAARRVDLTWPSSSTMATPRPGS